MKPKEWEDLTRTMRRDGIIRIGVTSCGRFTVAMRGNILGVGETVGEAYLDALASLPHEEDRRAA